MSIQARNAIEPAGNAVKIARWSPAKRIALRFCVSYFVLFSLTNQICGSFFPIPKLNFPDLSTLWPTRQVVLWTAAHIFHISPPPSYLETGSGDRTWDWLLAFCLLVLSVAVTAVWSLFDRKRDSYTTLYAWFRIFVRFALASQMFVYGMAKVVPLQMPFPSLTRLVEPFGNFSPMGVVWASVGASPAYETFAGCAEVLGGFFLIFPRTVTFGALICLVDMIQVFMLNMTYDVPVKLFSFNLVVMSLVLLAPDFGRLADFFFFSRTAAGASEAQPFRTHRGNRVALRVQVVYGILLLALFAYRSYLGWFQYGGGSPQSPLYGIWTVEQMSMDGQTRAPLLTDYDRWRRVIFQAPTSITFQRMDDSIARFGASIDSKQRTVSLTKANDKRWSAKLAFDRPAPDRLIANGTMGGHSIQMRLRQVDSKRLLLVSRGFHWIQEAPFNR